MKVLVFDCSGDTATAAVFEEKQLLSKVSVGGRKNHAAVLLPSIDECLRNAGVSIGGIDEVYVCSGPGSFTGVKVGIATALGLSDPLGIKVFVFPYYALVLARLLEEKPLVLNDSEVVLGIDAGRGEKYCTYVVKSVAPDDSGLLVESAGIELRGSSLIKTDKLQDAVGDGVYAEYEELHCELLFKLPDEILKCLVSDVIEPLYFRKSQAEESLEK